jgi:hypothetical protein
MERSISSNLLIIDSSRWAYNSSLVMCKERLAYPREQYPAHEVLQRLELQSPPLLPMATDNHP